MIYFKNVRKIKKNEKYISPVAIFGGFIIDSLTLQRIDLPFENEVDEYVDDEADYSNDDILEEE